MKIAQISPLYESVPPKLYGGTERVVSYLTEELVRLGHDVTLFASGDSVTESHLESVCEQSLRLAGCGDPLAYHVLQLDMVLSRAPEFDVMHFHTDYFHFPFTRNQPLPAVTTLHGRLDLEDLVPIYRRFGSLPLVSISQAQRRPMGRVNWVGNVYHGLPKDLYQAYGKHGEYLAFIGRISPEKRPDRAIRIAQKFGMPLKIAAKVDEVDRKYFESEIEPMLKSPGVDYIGEISDSEKNEFLGNAYAFLFPIDWPEPFGLSMIEAMACGTPTVAFSCGSVPEIIDEGVSGFIVNSEEAAVQALKRVENLNRLRCRGTFDRRFTACRMAKEYLSVYEAVVSEAPPLQSSGAMEISTTVLS